jgi:hypothetical protein
VIDRSVRQAIVDGNEPPVVGQESVMVEMCYEDRDEEEPRLVSDVEDVDAGLIDSSVVVRDDQEEVIDEKTDIEMKV